MVPPWAATISRAMYSPSPSPARPERSVGFTWAKRPKMVYQRLCRNPRARVLDDYFGDIGVALHADIVMRSVCGAWVMALVSRLSNHLLPAPGIAVDQHRIWRRREGEGLPLRQDLG